MSAVHIALLVSFVTLGILSHHCALSITVPTNTTTTSDTYDDAPTDDPSTLEESESELRERYRRLIPYMTYYVLNNYLSNSQQKPAPSALSAQSYAGNSSPAPAPMLRRPSSQAPGQYVTLRPVMTVGGGGNQRYQLVPQQQQQQQQQQRPLEDRFVPSVQYNPKELAGQEADYFVPVRYGAKEASAYEQYGSVRTVRPPVMTVSTIPDHTRYHTTSRPMTSFAPQKLKLTPSPKFHHQHQQQQQQQQQQLDYNLYGQEPEEFESIRYSTPRPQQLGPRYVQPQQPVAPRPSVLEPVPNSAYVSLNHVLKSLQLTNRLPERLSKDNIDSSIKTLVEILNILNMGKKESYAPVYQKPYYTKPKVITESNYEATQISVTPHNELVEIQPQSPYAHQINTQMPAPAPIPHEDVVEIKPVQRPYVNQIKTQAPARQQTAGRVPSEHADKIVEYYVPIVQDIDEEKVAYNPAGKEPSMSQSTEHSTGSNYDVSENNDEILEDERYTLPVTTEEAVPKLPVHVPSNVPSIVPPSLKYGATRGKPHVDYPAYTEIPETDFSCKQQRYKGFFGDPATSCQVWHYCDLNGGKSSFLCPNGTIFSQVALTCDWWFNVKCESTTQLYVLNERLYKYILPVIPKFPEDFTGPEVDKYLELKFKEMEAKLKVKKMKKLEEEKDSNALNTLQSIEDSK